MRNEIFDFWLRIKASYWFIPSVLSFSAVIAALVMVDLDARFGNDWINKIDWLSANQPDGARALLSTVAGSMITVAGVTFSMTLLAVSHASAQIGAKLLSNFMRDRGNQITLGVFIATFLYCLMVLRTVYSPSDSASAETASAFVPHLAIIVALILAVLSVMVLIYFVHHVPQSINVSTVVARLGDEMTRGIELLYPQRMGEGAGNHSTQALPADFKLNARCVRRQGRAGYLRVLDADGLLKLTCEHKLIVKLEIRPGNFSIEGQPLLWAYPAERVDDALAQTLQDLFSWGSERTREQDLWLPVEQLLEVLGKAMSPGVNGQYTAVLCLDQFERGIAKFLTRQIPDSRRFDDDGQLRVIAEPISADEFLHTLFPQIRQFIRGDFVTTRHTKAMLDRLLDMESLSHARTMLADQQQLLAEDIDSATLAPLERQQLQRQGQ